MAAACTDSLSALSQPAPRRAEGSFACMRCPAALLAAGHSLWIPDICRLSCRTISLSLHASPGHGLLDEAKAFGRTGGGLQEKQPESIAFRLSVSLRGSPRCAD